MTVEPTITPPLYASGALRLAGPETAALRALGSSPVLADAPAPLREAAQGYDRARRELLRVTTAGPHRASVHELAQSVADRWLNGTGAPADLLDRAAAAGAAEAAQVARQRVLTLAAGVLRDVAQERLHQHAAEVIRGPLAAELDRIRAAYRAAAEAVEGRDFLDPGAFVAAPTPVREAYVTVRELATAYTRLREMHRMFLIVEADGDTALALHLSAHHDAMPPTGTINLPSDPLARFLLVMRNPWCPSLQDMEDAHSTLNYTMRPKPAAELVESA